MREKRKESRICFKLNICRNNPMREREEEEEKKKRNKRNLIYDLIPSVNLGIGTRDDALKPKKYVQIES